MSIDIKIHYLLQS